MMSPYQFNRLSHRDRLQASLGGFGLTPGSGMVEVKAVNGAVMKAMTVAAPSLLKANVGVALTAPTINAGIAAKVGQYATTPSQSFLNLKTGTGADPQSWTRASQSQIALQPSVAKITGPNSAVPASDAPTPADTISKGVMNALPFNAPPPRMAESFLEGGRYAGKVNAFVMKDPAPPAQTFVAKPKDPVQPLVSDPVKNAIDKAFTPAQPTGTTNTWRENGTTNTWQDGTLQVQAKYMPDPAQPATAAPQPTVLAPNPLLIAGGVLALGVVVYLATR